jgi:hypothetical protein
VNGIVPVQSGLIDMAGTTTVTGYVFAGNNNKRLFHIRSTGHLKLDSTDNTDDAAASSINNNVLDRTKFPDLNYPFLFVVEGTMEMNNLKYESNYMSGFEILGLHSVSATP